MYSSVRAAMSSSRGVTRCRHPTNGRAIRRSPAGPLDLTRSAQVEAASSSLPATFQKENTILTDGVSFWSGRRGATRYRHPTNGRAIRRSPAGPLDLTRCAQVEAARSSLPAAFQKENTILTDGVSFVTGCRFCCPHPYTSRGRGSVRGKPLRVSPLAFNHPPAGDHFCIAKVQLQTRRDTRMCVSSFLERATRRDSLPASHEWQSHSQEPCRTS